MELAKNDKIILILQHEIAHKKRQLLNNFENIKKTSKLNHFLEDILEDYNSYFHYICEEKRQQEAYLLGILEHLDQIMLTQNLSEQALNQAKKDQMKVLQQISSIKKDLDEITNKGIIKNEEENEDGVIEFE